MINRSFLLALLLLLCGCSLAPRPQSLLSGKLAVDGLPLEGVRVAAYPAETARDLSARPAYLSRPSVDKGLFELWLPPGSYYLIARSGDLFGYYGRNPVTLGPDGLSGVHIALLLQGELPPLRQTAVTTGVQGRVTHRGDPLAGAMVQIYTDLTEELKGMGYQMAGPTDGEGHFDLELSPGTYYLMARSRGGGEQSGPLSAGDFIGYYPGNPIRIADGELVSLSLPVVEVPEAIHAYAATLFGGTSIRGRVLDQDGRPLAGIRVLLYKGPAMLDRPLYVSQLSDGQGRYVLSFPKGGLYYLSARSALGGAPSPGELYGTWDGSLDHSLELKAGEQREGIDIRVEEMW